LGGRIFWILFLHFLEEKHVSPSVCIIIQTPAQRFFCSTRVKQVKYVERPWVNIPINERLQWRRRRWEWRNNNRRSSREFLPNKVYALNLVEERRGKKGPSMVMASAQTSLEMRRSWLDHSRKRKYYLRSNENNFAARFVASGKLRFTREAEMRRVISDVITQSGQASLKCVDQSFRFQIKTSNAVPSSFHRVYR
jgi:hypothetical protein